MGLQVNRLSKGDGVMSTQTRAQVRIYRSTGGLFVGEGDPRGAFLAYGVGDEISAGDVNRYKQFMSNEPQDGAESLSQAAAAYTDEAARDELRRRQAGDTSARTPLGQAPVLVHDRLATELADEAAALAAAPAGDVAAMRNGLDADGVYATHAIWRTAEGDLVHEGDENGATLAYPVGARIDDADVDEYNDLGDPPSGDDEPSPDTTKAAAKPANKARGRTADK